MGKALVQIHDVITLLTFFSAFTYKRCFGTSKRLDNVVSLTSFRIKCNQSTELLKAQLL